MTMIDELVFSAIKKYDMLQPQDNVMVCVSGGADSMALLCFLRENSERLSIAALTACHFNHGLRGAESDRDEAAVRAYCAHLGVPLACGRGDMSGKERPRGKSTELWARELRYAFFLRLAKEKHAKIAVAHNQNDAAETLLFNLARGTGLRGARGIPPVRDGIIRPFIGVPRARIEAYCAEKDVPYVTDSTNLADECARNRIRHTVLPALCGVNENAPNNIARFCAQAGELNEYMERQARELLAHAKVSGGWSAAALGAADETLMKYALKALIAGVREADERLVTLALDVARGALRELQLTESVRLCGDGGVLRLYTRTEKPFSANGGERKLVLGRNIFCETALIAEKIKLNHERKGNFPQRLLNNSIDCDRIIGNIVLRARRPGDVFSSARRNNTKTLKKLLNEKGVPPEKRDRVPVLSDDEGIVFVAGEGPSRRAAADKTSENIINISIEEGEPACTTTF